MHNLTAFIRFHATERPNDLAVVYGRARITYADLLDRALAAGARLLAVRTKPPLSPFPSPQPPSHPPAL